MAEKNPSLSEKLDRIKSAAQKLPQAAATINSATDALGKAVAELDSVLKKYGLGVPTWVSFHTQVDHDAGHLYEEYVGYAKVNGKWGIAVATYTFNENCPPREDEWLFNDAPRKLRVDAVGKIPDLLEAIVKEARDMSLKIDEKTAEVSAYASGIREVLDKREEVSIGTLMKGGKVNVGTLMQGIAEPKSKDGK